MPQNDVLLEVVLPGERLSTILTPVRPLPGVDDHVPRDVARPPRCLAAQAAEVHLLAGHGDAAVDSCVGGFQLDRLLLPRGCQLLRRCPQKTRH